MTRWICVHGHFYQPPRENPWLESIETQPSAYPYHDWNERVAAECYAPNAAARILDQRRRITRITSNYERISFDFGPTLLAWLEAHDPETYAAILMADHASRGRFGGHGSALAQAYNHIIMPLANDADIRTQVCWGLRDFRHRFGRDAEGMWLPEAAVDVRTLEALAAHDVRFTILAPGQAAAVRRLDGGEWVDVTGQRIDPSNAYLCRLPSGREIRLFFYDGPVSRAVAFENLLSDGARFARRLTDLATAGSEPRLAHIATDGETYGHHHRFGEMALAFALQRIESTDGVQLVNYAQFLESQPLQHEVRILENTSWSCAHGVERWRSDCGCSAGGRPGWTQAWRAPLRAALDWLRDRVAEPFEREASRLLRDPAAARDDYIDIVLDRSDPSVDDFMARHAVAGGEETVARVLGLMELQRNTMLMYTSCAWFFNDLAGVETVQILRYAGRVIQLSRDLLAVDMEPEFLAGLETAVSNAPEAGNGRRIWDEHVRPAMISLLHVGAHYAVSSVFPGHEVQGRVYSYRVNLEDGSSAADGDATLSVGRMAVTSDITRESARLTFSVLHFGGHNLSGGIRRFDSEPAFQDLRRRLLDAFERHELSEVIQIMAGFPEYTFSLRSLFPERQREILYRLIDENLRDAESSYRHVFEDNLALMHYLGDLGMPMPRPFTVAAEFVLNRDLIRTFGADPVDVQAARTLLDRAQSTHIQLDREGIAFAIRGALERLVARVVGEAPRMEPLDALNDLVSLARSSGFEVDLWRVQNAFYEASHTIWPAIAARGREGNEPAAAWADRFVAAGGQFDMAVE
ncbi:MAG: DUF3536 domain-containing protein [Gemmatimonadetes bacterium]|nr:DUF3536 domain-containing protein [Gemmatimonadota bacterium]